MIRLERTDGLGPSKCRACGARIIWAMTDRGKRAPIDAEPYADGNMFLFYDCSGDEAGKPRVSSLAAHHLATGLVVPPEERRKNHFATCPEAERFQPEKPPTSTAQLTLFRGGRS